MVVFYKRTTNDYCDEIEKILPLSRLSLSLFLVVPRLVAGTTSYRSLLPL